MNKNYFFYSFKKETGLTPLSYCGAKLGGSLGGDIGGSI
jgi:hypothetical protein